MKASELCAIANDIEARIAPKVAKIDECLKLLAIDGHKEFNLTSAYSIYYAHSYSTYHTQLGERPQSSTLDKTRLLGEAAIYLLTDVDQKHIRNNLENRGFKFEKRKIQQYSHVVSKTINKTVKKRFLFWKWEKEVFDRMEPTAVYSDVYVDYLTFCCGDHE